MVFSQRERFARHPSQIYEFLLEGLLLFILLLAVRTPCAPGRINPVF
jgi:prolipoprotein diacylglyceryltransferase